VAAVGLAPLADSIPVSVQIDDGEDVPEFDTKGAILSIRHGDGTVTVSMDGRPISEAPAANDDEEWYGNLVDRIGASELSAIVDDLLRGIDEDIESRRDWIEDRAQGIKLLGLKIETPNLASAADGAPVEGMSKVRHPLLLEAVLRFQANARSEFLPTDGPVKIRNDSMEPDLASDQLATLLERELNHYLTAVATEYYPDTDRMLFMAGFGGDGFKKVYQCPLRNRAVSESVDADDLIVNQSATDLSNAQRVTHRTFLKPSTVKRLQILGVYADVPLSDPVMSSPDALQAEEKAQQGLKPDSMRNPRDQEREIYEVYCELDIQGFEHRHKGKVSGLAIPYVVTIDKSSRQALSVVRNFADNGDKLPTARKRFVKWPFVPGIGFYAIGLLNILGNTTNAITAGWREMLDCGMFANFPGFLYADSGMRQNTNIFRVPPGGGAPIKGLNGPIRDAIMALPYSTQGMPALGALVDNMAETGRRIGGTAEVQVGEGRADVPVGTVMAMIDQAVKVMNAVHKRMHSAQAEEFQLLRDVIAEHPQEFLEACDRGCRSARSQLTEDRLIAALKSCALVPQADPNTSSSGQRLMKIMGLMQLQSAAPQLYDPIKIHQAALVAMGWSNPDEFMVPPAARAAPPPQLQEMQQKMANEKAAADAKTMEAQAKLMEARGLSAESYAKIQGGVHQAQAPEAAPQGLSPAEATDAAVRLLDAKTKAKEADIKAKGLAIENQNRDLDRQATEKDTLIGLAKELLKNPAAATTVGAQVDAISKEIGKQP